MDIKKTPKNADIFNCETCHFKCSKQSDWNRHITRPKHLRIQNGTKKTPENAKQYLCSHCGKDYKYSSGLWKHTKNGCNTPCNEKEEAPITIITSLLNENKELINDNKDFKNFILELMKNNEQLQKQMLEVCKTGNTMINSNNNSNNKTFNMQFFLNEQCKDAMNITEFIDSFQLQFADLERVGQLGYVDGISDIIIKKLNEMDIYKRPIHCSDTKRDIMYVRADNVWEKETNGHDRVRLLVRQVTHKNIKLLPLWTAEYPEAKDIHHSLNDTYIGMVGQAMGGRGDLEENENKIIKRIAKTVYIDKY